MYTCMIYRFLGFPIGPWYLSDIHAIYQAGVLWSSMYSDIDTLQKKNRKKYGNKWFPGGRNLIDLRGILLAVFWPSFMGLIWILCKREASKVGKKSSVEICLETRASWRHHKLTSINSAWWRHDVIMAHFFLEQSQGKLPAPDVTFCGHIFITFSWKFSCIFCRLLSKRIYWNARHDAGCIYLHKLMHYFFSESGSNPNQYSSRTVEEYLICMSVLIGWRGSAKLGYRCQSNTSKKNKQEKQQF